MKIKTLFFTVMVMIISCQNNDTVVTNSSNLLIGNWSFEQVNANNNEISYKRTVVLPKEQYGFSLKNDNICVERTSGWCGTPPLSFFNEEGKWERNNDTLKIKRMQGHYAGDVTFLIVKLTTTKLVLKRIKTSQNAERIAVENLYNDIYTQFISKISCTTSEELQAIPYGAKACGGHKGYLPFSTQMENADQYLQLIKKFTEKEDAYNKKWGVISDCSIVNPPTEIICNNGRPLFKYK